MYKAIALLFCLILTSPALAASAWSWGGDPSTSDQWTVIKTFTSGSFSNLGSGHYLSIDDPSGGDMMVHAAVVVSTSSTFQARLKIQTVDRVFYVGSAYGSGSGTYPIMGMVNLDTSDYTVDLEVRLIGEGSVQVLSPTTIQAFEPRRAR